MSLKLWATKRDQNEPDIVAALQAVGASVTRLSQKGFPDLAVGHRGVNYLFEVKVPGAKLTEAQREWFWLWNGTVVVVTSPEQALRAIGALEVARDPSPRKRIAQRGTRRGWGRF